MTTTPDPLPERIGIFGGTFDPIHFGHLRPAIELCELLSLSSLRMLPCHLPAHRAQPGATSKQRIEMLHLACDDTPKLSVDNREALRDTPSYSVDTLKTYKSEFPSSQLLFFMGMDAFAKFTHWYHWEEILTLAHLVVIDRPGAVLSGPEERLLMSRQASRLPMSAARSAAKTRSDNQLDISSGEIVVQSVSQSDISATRIRELIAAGRDIRYLLPEPVRHYIAQHKLYQ